MNRERAEAHLRLLAEDELRRATMLVPDATAGSPPEQAMRRASVTGTLAGSAAGGPWWPGWRGYWPPWARSMMRSPIRS